MRQTSRGGRADPGRAGRRGVPRGGRRPAGHLACLAILCGGLPLAVAAPAGAEPKTPEPVTATPDTAALIGPDVVAQLRDLVSNEVVTVMLRSQNARYGDLSEAELLALDGVWRAEREQEDRPLISMTLTNPLSSYLTRVQSGSYGLLTAVFVMDRNGLNAGQSEPTTDFWQGDEAKFTETFPRGAEGLDLGAPEWLDSLAAWIGQVSLTLTDPADGRPIGAATFDVNLDELSRRRAAGLY